MLPSPGSSQRFQSWNMNVTPRDGCTDPSHHFSLLSTCLALLHSLLVILLGGDVDVTDYDFPLYVRDGQALAWMYGCSVAVREAEALDEISQALQITWVKRW